MKELVLIPLDDELSVPLLVSVKPVSRSNPGRLAEMRNFNASGNAIVDRLSGDSMQSLALEAYGDACKWWIIAEANKVMSDKELSALSKITIPNIEDTSWNPHVYQADDDGMSFHYYNRITGYIWREYYSPMVSQLDPPEYEDNPNWLRGLAFVVGGDKKPWMARGSYISRSYPNPVVSGEELVAISSGSPNFTRIPLPIDPNVIAQLPTFSDVNPPAPPIRVAEGSNGAVARDLMKPFPDREVLDPIRQAGIEVVTVRASIVEVIPALRNEPIPSWGANKTWNDVPGGYDKNRKLIVIATESTNHGVLNLGGHELSHAYDDVKGGLSSKPDFDNAFRADYAALEKADVANQGYYTKADTNTGRTEPTFTRARSEAFAEGMSNYFTNNAHWFHDKPALLRYFQSYTRPQPNWVGPR